MKLVVLGGCGAMGSGIVRDLIWEKSEGVEKVIVADCNVKKAESLVSELGDNRLEAQFIDVANKGEMIGLLKTVDVCVNNVPILAGYQMGIFDACLEAGRPYIDLGGLGVVTKEQKKLHEKFVTNGVPAVLGMGSAPGFTNVLAKCCAEHLDKVEKLNVYWGGKYIGPESPVFVAPYNILTLISEYADANTQYIDGEAKKMPPLSGAQFIGLPQPFGRIEFVHTSHSETATIPGAFKDKGVREVTWRLHMPERCDEVMKALMSVGFGDREPVEVNGVDIVPEKFLEALINRNAEKNKDKIPAPAFGEAEDHEIYFAVGEGEKAGERAKVTSMCYQSPDRLYMEYGDAATSMSASIGAQMLGRGEIKPGVWGPEECIDTKRFFEELKKRNFKITVSEERLM